MSNTPQPGMFIQVLGQQRNFHWFAEPHQLKEQIQKAEALSEAIWKGLALFIPPVNFVGDRLEETTDRLMAVRNSLRDFLCCELEQKLADMEANPLPTQEEMEKQMRAQLPPSLSKPWEPTADELYKAQRNVELLDGAIQKIRDMKENDVPGWEMLEAAMLPQYEVQLQSAQEYLSKIHEKMDEAAKLPMSNGTESGEGSVPDEAKP